MIKVFVRVDGVLHSAEIAGEVYVALRKKADETSCPIHVLLREVVNKYGNVLEENVQKFLNKAQT